MDFRQGLRGCPRTPATRMKRIDRVPDTSPNKGNLGTSRKEKRFMEGALYTTQKQFVPTGISR